MTKGQSQTTHSRTVFRTEAVMPEAGRTPRRRAPVHDVTKQHDNARGRLILAVDDEEALLGLMVRILTRQGYRVMEAQNGAEALARVEEEIPDLIFLDLRMPGMGGLETLQHLKADQRTALVPVIVVTADADEKVRALDLGADDFVAKPFDPAELLARTRAHLRLRQAIQDLDNAESILVSVARLVEVKDAYTEQHVERVAQVAVQLGRMLGLSQEELKALQRGALLHDIGKIGISERILKKPGRLTEDEFEEMKRHVLIGEEICWPLRTLRGALSIIRNHHERWDGSGYPDGLAREEIPLMARIVAVADVFDALGSDRAYRRALPPDQVLRILSAESGHSLDPLLVDLLMRLIDEGGV